MELLFESKFDYSFPSEVYIKQIRDGIRSGFSEKSEQRVCELIALCTELAIAIEKIRGEMRIFAAGNARTQFSIFVQ